MEASDVVVVGAGIGGAVLALALGREGWKVTLLEREKQPPRMMRPEVLWGATPAALDRFGVGDVIRKQAGVRLDGVEMRVGERRLLALTREVLASAKAEAYSTDPNATREAIAAAAAATGNVTFLRGVDVQEIVRDGGKVTGVVATQEGTRQEHRARLVVGDDGAHSVVRSAVLRDMKLSVFPLDFVTAGIDWPNELPPDQVRGWFNPRAIREGVPAIGLLPWPAGKGVALLPMPHERAEKLLAGPAEAFWSQLSKLTPLADSLAAMLRFPDDFKRVRRPYGHAPQYVADGVAILGDAAHPVSPAGGQGANAAIWDALALADVVHEALTVGDVSSRERLTRYEALRRGPNSDSVRITQRVDGLFRYAGYVPGLQWLVPAVAQGLDRSLKFKAAIVSTFATTFVTR